MDPLAFGLLLTFLPLLGGVVIFFASNLQKGAVFSTSCVYAGFFLSICLWIFGTPHMKTEPIFGLSLTPLSRIMMTLVLYISAIIHHYSIRYMKGQKLFASYMCKLGFLTSSVLFLMMADHLVLLALFWSISNLLLTALMIHDQRRPESKQTGILAAKGFLIGSISLAASFTILYLKTGSTSLEDIINRQHLLSSAARNAAAILLAITAVIQSGIFPFHKWLLSSLNSPTIVSAFMHAGLINGGGLLIIRFAPLFSQSSLLMTAIFSIGFVSLFLGSIWTLIQHSAKRMLACSTMSQMGFMFIQCGLGLFPAAVAHLCWHSLFKAFLFLQSGSALEEQRLKFDQGANPRVFIYACLFGVPGAFAFAKIAHYEITAVNGSLVLIFFAFIATTQAALTIIRTKLNILKGVFAIACSCISGTIYGISVAVVESALPNLNANAIQPLTSLHLISIAIAALFWTILNLKFKHYFLQTNFWKSTYVRLLNASQPDPSTLAL